MNRWCAQNSKWSHFVIGKVVVAKFLTFITVMILLIYISFQSGFAIEKGEKNVPALRQCVQCTDIAMGQQIQYIAFNIG